MKPVLCIVFVLITASIGLSTQTPDPFDATFLTRPGDPMPDFSLLTTDGSTIQSTDLKGKLILINFFATWCPPCNKELPHLEKDVWARYKDHPAFALLVIAREHKLEEIQKFKQEKNLTLPMGVDPDRSIYKKFATQTIPRNYLIGRDGRIIYQSQGFNEEEWSRLLDLIEKNLGD